MMLIEIRDKMRHGGTICRVAIVHLTDQIGPKRVKIMDRGEGGGGGGGHGPPLFE